MKSVFAFHAVIRPATPTGSSVTVVLSQFRVSGNSWSACSAARNGVTGYLEVLTDETNAFSTELGLVQAQLNELLAVVQLYQALGGGWQQ